MFTIDSNSYRSTKTFNRRARFLVMHYTAGNFAEAVESLTGASAHASAHYLVPDPTDKTYLDAGFNAVRIFDLVDETERAWHAGISSWEDRNNLNDTSIGIEIVNAASEAGEGTSGVFTFPPYHPDQIAAVKQLAINILQRYADILPTHVVAHSDIAVGRKSDPGPEFPWKDLYDAGIGAWYEEDDKHECLRTLTAVPSQADVIAKFKRYGYDTSAAGDADGFKQLVRAFQLHFRPSNYSGELDIETAAILYALVKKYFPS